ncbi:MAG: hypothetical protein QG657_1040 [Acidobacteriota bacterium]|nr:hypothetical protein [Acidobacteriota bacterium]
MREDFKKSMKCKLVFLMVMAFVLIIPGLSIAQDETNSQSQPPDIEIFMKNGIYQWTENNPYMKKLVNTRFWEDLQRSGQFIGLLTMGTQLEKQTGLHLDANYIRELLDAPVEISLWDAFEKDKTPRFVAVLDVEPQDQWLIKLAEVYAQGIKKSTVIERNNLKILKTEWLDNTLYHLMLKKQLVVANNLDVFLQVMGLASKDGTIHSFRDSDFFRNFHSSQDGNLKCRIDLTAYLKNFKSVLDKDSMQLAINMDLDKTVNFYSLFLTAEPVLLAPELCALDNSKEFIPREPALATAGLYVPHYYLGMIKRSDYFQELNGTLNLDIEKEIIPLFSERFFFYLMDFQDAANPNILNGVVGFYLNKCTPEQVEKIVALVQALMAKSDETMDVENEEEKGGVDIYRFPEDDRPAFCVVKNCLLVGTGYDALKQSLAVFHKKSPSLSDGKGYKTLAKEYSTKGYCQILADPARIFKSLGNHFQFAAGSTREFSAADVKLKVLPVFDIFSQIPAFGIFWEFNNESLTGKVRFVDNAGR